MIRITRPDAIEIIQGVLVNLGAIPLPVSDDGLIVMTPDQFTKIVDAARAGAIEMHMAEQHYTAGEQKH